MQALDFCATLTAELHRTRTRCKDIEETRRALEVERTALQARNQALESAAAMLLSSDRVVVGARTRQARLNPAGLYQSTQYVVDAAYAARAQLNQQDAEIVAKKATKRLLNQNSSRTKVRKQA